MVRVKFRLPIPRGLVSQKLSTFLKQPPSFEVFASGQKLSMIHFFSALLIVRLIGESPSMSADIALEENMSAEAIPSTSSESSYRIEPFVFAAAPASSADGYTVRGTLGQPTAALSSNGDYSLTAGFWGYDQIKFVEVPNLAISVRSTLNQITISWAPQSKGFVLQESVSLVGALWTTVPATAPLTIPIEAQQKFYRLYKP